MRNIKAIMALILISDLSFGQRAVTFTQQVVEDFGSLQIDVPFDKRSKFIEVQLNSARDFKGTRTISCGRSNISIDSNGKVVSFTKAFVYKTRTIDDGYTVQFVKSKNGLDLSQLEFTYQEVAQLIDDAGYVVLCDFLDGSGSTCFFYSPELSLLKTYKPYEKGFYITKLGFDSNLFCVYSENYDRSAYKLALLNHGGDLLTEREFRTDNYLPSDIKIVNGRILLLMNNTRIGGADVIAFDSSLNIQWKKSFAKGIVGYNLIQSELSNSVIVRTQEELGCYNADNGTSLWSISPDRLGSRINASKMIEAEYVIDDQYVAVNVGTLQSSISNKVVENTLSVIDNKSGKIVYQEKLGDAQEPIRILDGTKSFITVKDSELKQFRSQ